MNEDNETLKSEGRKIVLSTFLFVIIIILILSLCAVSVWYGSSCVGKFFTQWHLQSWEKYGVLIGIGGFVLFFQIILSLFDKGNIPPGYKLITEFSHPEPFVIIKEIKNKLGVTKNVPVFLTNNISASVFVLPQIQNLFKKPERYISVGQPLIDNLSKEELQAVLFHEFAHFSQGTIDSTSRAASIGLFANSFLSEKIELKASAGPGNLTLSLNILFYTLLDYLCRFIKKHYDRIYEELEYEADKKAIQHVKPEILSNALIHIERLMGNKNVPYPILKRIELMGGHYVLDNSESKTARICISLYRRRRMIPLVDSSYPVLLNGKTIGKGNYLKSFTIEKEVPPNLYTVDVTSYISTLVSKPFTFEANAGFVYHIELDFKHSFIKANYSFFCRKINVYNKQLDN